MSGNLCRCTGYMGIVNAIERVMAEATVEAQPAPAAGSWLGPAPGPQVTTGRTMFPRRVGTEARAPRPPRRAAAPLRRLAGKKVAVTVGPVEEKDGLVHLNQSFILEHPREAAWRLMSDPEAVARCMPGARLDGPPVDDKLSGRMEVKLGPIAASFAGQGTVIAYPAEYRQVIEGQGGDRKSGSRVSGRVDYRLTAVEAQGKPATRVDVTIAYGLTGLLAQLGRSALARDLARDMGETFAQNIDAQLRDPAAAPAEGRTLGGFALARRILAARVRAFLARVLGR